MLSPRGARGYISGALGEQDDVIFSLNDRLRERKAETHRLRHDLEHQGPYEDLLSRPRQRENEFVAEMEAREGRRCAAEDESRRLRALLDEREGVEVRELERLERELRVVMGESAEKDELIRRLEDTAHRLEGETARRHTREDEDEALLARLGARVEGGRQEQQELQEVNADLQDQVETQHQLLQAREKEKAELRRYHDQREEELSHDIERMRRRHNEYVDAQAAIMDEKEEEIRTLYKKLARLEMIVDEAENLTYEQRADLSAKRREIQGLSMAVERSQKADLFS